MSYETIIEMTERLASELILFDPEQPDAIKTLLPILKSIHAQCKALELSSEAAQILKVRHIINAIIEGGPPVESSLLSNLDMIVSDFSAKLKNMDQKQSDASSPSKQSDHQEPNSEYEELEEKLNGLSMLIAGFCPGKEDIEEMMHNVDGLINISETIEPSTFYDISKLCKQYMENMDDSCACNTKPVEEGIVLLKSILSHLKRHEPFTFDYSDVLELLEEHLTAGEPCDDCTYDCEEDEPDAVSEPEDNGAPEKLSEDDIEILTDFISEAEDNLNSIEVSLIELEQDPTNADIINDIFRPFHTIKGVSGFLSLDKINRLSHATENLLDSARSGDFTINHSATDAVLESVDLLKQLIENAKVGLENGYRKDDSHIDVEILRDKLKRLQISLTKGGKEPLGEILVRKKDLKEEDVEEALEIQRKHPEKKFGEILIEDKKVAPAQVASALMEQSTVKRRLDSQVKVSTQKLDDLVDYAGELVICPVHAAPADHGKFRLEPGPFRNWGRL